jgi:uncharacterized protein (TIGR03437 family)
MNFSFSLLVASACLVSVMLPRSCFAQPAIGANGVVNAASYAGVPPVAGAEPIVAQGSIFIVFGTGLGPTTLTHSGPLPYNTSLSGTSIRFTSGTTGVDAYMVYTSDLQVAAILPSNAPTGAGTVTVSYMGQTSAPQALTVVKSSFGMFTRNQAGSGPAVIQNYVSAASTPFNGLATAAQPGQTLILYGTGLGPISGPDNVAPGAVSPRDDVSIIVGGVTLTPVYAGRAPQFPGEDQINFVLPSGDFLVGSALTTGCYVPITVKVGGDVSPTTTLAIANGQPNCDHALGLTAAQEAALDNGGSLNVGLSLLGDLNVPLLGAAGVALAGFSTLNADGAYNAISLLGGQPYVAVNTCAVVDSSSINSQGVPSLSAFQSLLKSAKLLDAGPSLTLTTPSASHPMTGLEGPYFYASPTLVFSAGAWTIAGMGGHDVGAFSAPISLPDPISWTNGPTANSVITRGAINFAWTGGGANDLASVTAAAILIDPNDPENSVGKIALCVVPANAHSATIPANLVSQLPVAPAGNAGAYTGVLAIGSGASTTFSAQGLDAGILAYVSTDARTVTFQ